MRLSFCYLLITFIVPTLTGFVHVLLRVALHLSTKFLKMDELRAFYNNPGGRRVVKLRGPQTSGVRLTHDDHTDDMDRKQEHRKTVLMSGTDYAVEVKERELQRYLRVILTL